MTKKRLTKTLWYGSEVDLNGNPVLPPLATGADDLEGLHEGELYLHLGEGEASVYSRSADGKIVRLGGDMSVLEGYLKKSVWEHVFEVRKNEDGVEYLFTKLNLVTQYGITMYADGEHLDLPSIYAGLPIDNSTIYWEDILDGDGNKTGQRLVARVVGEGGEVVATMLGDLKNVGAWANGVAEEDRIMVQKKDSDTWVGMKLSELGGGKADFSNVLSLGSGNAYTSFTLSEDKKTLTFVKGEAFAKQSELANKANWDAAYSWGSHANAGYVTEEWVGDNYLGLGGGTITGDLRLKGSVYYGNALNFGDGEYVYLKEATDDELTIYADKGLVLKTGSRYTATLNGSDILTDSYSKITNWDAAFGWGDHSKAGYVTTSGAQTITGEKDFTGGLKVNGSAIVYDKTNKYWKLTGDLLVTGGITMYGNDSSFNPSTITDAVKVDGITIVKDKTTGALMINPDIELGGGGGGEITTVAWNNVTGRPTKLSEFTDDIGIVNTEKTEQTISKKKTFANGCWVLAANENGIISNYHMGNSTWGNVVSPTLYGIRNGISFDWQNTKWVIGNIRGNATDSYGFGIGYYDSGKLLPSFRVSTGGAVYTDGGLYPNSNNGSPIGSSSYQWSNLFSKKATIDGIEIKKSTTDVLYIDANLVVRGGITMYGTDGTAASSIWDGAPKATTTNTPNGKGIASFDSKFFSVDNGHVTFIGSTGGGLDETALKNYLTTNKYLTKDSADNAYLSKSSYTAADVLSKLKGVDGANSGLDADTLDSIHASGFYSSQRGNFDSSELATFSKRNSGSYGVAYYNSVGSFSHSGNLVVLSRYDSSTNVSSGSVSAIELLASHYELKKEYPIQVRLTVDNSRYTSWKSLAFTDSDITGNAATATTASKLSTTSKTAWGQTYWTSGGVPTTISGSLSNVGSIYMSGYIGINNASPTCQLDILNSTSDTNTFVHAARTDTGYGISFGVGRGGVNRGLYDDNLDKWLIYTDASKVCLAQDIWINQDAWNGGLKLNRTSSGSGCGITVLSNGTELGQFGIAGNGRFEFDTYSGGTKFYVDTSGNGLFYGGITMYSDERKKTILNHVELSLKEVADAPIIEHYYNSDEKKTTHVGSIAQYWAGLNDWFCKEDGEGFLTMEIQNAALASAISVARELMRYESKTDKQIRLLKKRICELEDEIETLKGK